ncbi:MAG: hypothetical protein Roseis2KO_18010 [Roseivirga sp.]
MRVRLILALLTLQCSLMGQNFTAFDTLQLPGLTKPVFEWVDADNDSLLDILITGEDIRVTDSSRSVSYFYHQQDDTTFMLVATDLETYGEQLLRLVDFNRDGRQDLLVSSTDGTGFEHAIYENNGDFTWTKILINEGTSVWQELRLADLDNDGMPEILTFSTDGLIVYKNESTGFQPITLPAGLDEIHTDPVVLDFDKDGFTDLFIAGVRQDGDSVALLLINQKGLEFAVQAVESDSLQITDYVVSDFNDDGFPDVLVSRDIDSSPRSLEVLINNGGVNFSSQSDNNRLRLKNTKVFAADLSSDGLLDTDVEGTTIGQVGRLLARERTFNTSQGVSYEADTLANTSGQGRRYGDFDFDGDLDHFEMTTDLTGSVLWLFENMASDVNQGPTNLEDLLSFRFENDLYIVWNIAEDDLTENKSVTYDVNLGTGLGMNDIVAGGFDPLSLRRTIVGPGNQGYNSFIILKDAPTQPLFASIMPIDNAFHYTVSECLQGGAGGSCNEELLVQERALCGTNNITLQTETSEEARWFSAKDGYLGTSDQLSFTAQEQDFVIAVYDRQGGCVDGEVFSIIPDQELEPLADLVICEGDEVNVEVEGTWNSIEWSSANEGVLSMTSELVFTPEADDVITVEVTSANGCDYQQSFSIGIDEIMANVRDTVAQVTEGESVQLFASGGTEYLWTPATGLSATDVAAPFASPDTNTLYTVSVSNDTGCTDQATVLVEVTMTAFAPDMFSPNGDGRNERFMLYDLESAASFTFSIFDRAGNTVFESSDLNEVTVRGWDGTRAGTELPSGTYFWRVEGDYPNGQTITVNGKNKGALQLVR